MRVLEVLIILFLLFLFLQLGITAAAESYKDLNVPEDKWWEVSRYTNSDTKIKYDVKVKDGERIDVYILSSSAYDNYENDKSFNPAKKHENVWSANGKYETPDDQKYYLIVDNWDNGNSGDAQPEGDVIVDVEIDYETISEEEFFAMTAVCCSGGIIVLVIVIVVIYFLFIKKKEPKLQPVYIPPQPQPVPPPQYQPPPPQQPPSQPPYYPP